jgi:hypothetical protein
MHAQTELKDGVLSFGVNMLTGAIMIASWLSVLVVVLVLVRVLNYDHERNPNPLDW